MTDEQRQLIGDVLVSTMFYDALCVMLKEKKQTSASALTKNFTDPVDKISKLLEASGECSVLTQLAFDFRVLRNEALKRKGMNPEA